MVDVAWARYRWWVCHGLGIDGGWVWHGLGIDGGCGMG